MKPKCFICGENIYSAKDDYIVIEGIKIPIVGFQENVRLCICNKCYKERTNKGDFV